MSKYRYESVDTAMVEKQEHTSTRFQFERFYSFCFFFLFIIIIFLLFDKRLGWRKSNQRAKKYETKKETGEHKFLKFCCSSFVIT